MEKAHSPSCKRSDALAIATGLVVVQIIACFAVRNSNHQVYQATIDLKAAGWFAIPAGPAINGLTTLSAAFQGGTFFTLTIGAGLVLAAWAAVRLWRLLLPKSPFWYWVVIGAAALCLAYVNTRGWVWFPSLLAVGAIIPTGWIAGKFSPPAGSHARWWIPLTVLLVLTGTWGAGIFATQRQHGMFITIRDRLLLSNAIGSKVNDYYYRNTLYAAELFKSFNQKTIRSCRLQGVKDPAISRRLTALLAARDVLVIDGESVADLTVECPAPIPNTGRPGRNDQPLILMTGNGRELTTDLFALTSDPDLWLTRISNLGDRYAPFRRMTLVGVLVGFPVLLYTIIYGLLCTLSGLLYHDIRATWMASAICLIVGLLLLLPMLTTPSADLAPDEINAALTSDDLTRRLAGLQTIERDKLDIEQIPAFQALRDNPATTAVERYYIARALAWSHDKRAFADLLKMIDDPQPNVVCQVYYALGQQGNPIAIDRIKSGILLSDHWYSQWYGYHAMRRLGWRQTQSN